MSTLTIVHDPSRCGGALTIGESRLPLTTIRDAMMNGYTAEEARLLYPDLTPEAAEVCEKLLAVIEDLTS